MAMTNAPRPEWAPRIGDKKVFDARFDEIFRKRKAKPRKPVVPDNICPDCRRQKAGGVQDCAAGLCPKWWAPRDPDADKDCARVKAANAKPKNLAQTVLTVLGPALA